MATSEKDLKADAQFAEDSPASELSVQVYDEKATQRLLRKIDWYLLPFLAFLYLLSFLDRSNIGNARLAGLETSLNMSGLDYNVSRLTHVSWTRC